MINIEVYSTHAVIRSQQPLTVGLTGASAHFAFGKPWDQLIKTAVFRQGEKTVTVADIGQQVEFPWEVLTLPGVPVMIGVYGTDPEGKLVIPTLWAETEPVRPGADPQGGVTPADPTAPVWAQLQSNMGSREQLNTNDKTSLVAAINEANRAVRAVTVSGADGSYETQITMAELSAALDAGKSPQCYWEEYGVWLPLSKLDIRKTGISFADFSMTAKNKEYYIHMTGVSGGDMEVTGSVTVLATGKSKLPNPEKLTLIGSATAEYDGSEAVSVDIPTKVSQLQNDSGFLTEAPVTSVNGQTGAVAVSTAIKVEVWQKNDGSYDYSHNSLRIMNALSAGNTVFCRLGTHYLLSLVYATPAKCIFTGAYDGNLYTVTVTSTGATVTTTPLSSGGGGADGITPHIGANGNWWIGEEDTGVSATGGSGLSDTEKGLILSLFKSAVYSSDMSATITQLESLWGGSGDVPVEPDEPDEPETITYTVTNNLTGVTNSNGATTVNKGESYSATLTVAEGYTLDTLTVTMGGVDITDTAYGDGYITIYDVTGDIVVTAVGILPAPVYELATVLDCDGTQEAVDTGIVLMDDANKEFTVMVDYELKPDIGLGGYVFMNQEGDNVGNQRSFALRNSAWMGKISDNVLYFNATQHYMREPSPVTKTKLVVTHSKGSITAACYDVRNDANTRNTNPALGGSYNWFNNSTTGSMLLAAESFIGTINRFKVYDRVVTENEITEFLGVE